jgi:chaperonin GroEL
VAQINVGAATEAEMKEKKARVEDALHACRAAVEEGILPGGGVSTLKCLSVLDKVKCSGDEKIGVDIIRRAVVAPIKQIATNAGLDGSIVAQKVLESEEGQVWRDRADQGRTDRIAEWCVNRITAADDRCDGQ